MPNISASLSVRGGPYACPPAIAIDDAVAIVGPGVVDKAAIPAPYPCIGLVIEKPTPTTCMVTKSGEHRPTVMAPLPPGIPLYVGPVPGVLVPVPPPGPPGPQMVAIFDTIKLEVMLGGAP